MLSKEFLVQRGYCCGHGCLMCPYEPKHTEGNTNLMGYGNVNKKTLTNLLSTFTVSETSVFLG